MVKAESPGDRAQRPRSAAGRIHLLVWNRYDVTDALGLGLGVIARSKSLRRSAYGEASGSPRRELLNSRGIEAH
jgi:hypothetical protein